MKRSRRTKRKGLVTLQVLAIILRTIWFLIVVAVKTAAYIVKVVQSEMPLKIERMSDVEAEAAFKRTRSADEVSEWVEMLRSENIAIGSSFRFPTEVLEVETPTEDGSGVVTTPVTFLVDSTSDDDPDGITDRTAKRRFNAAAKILGFNLSWKEPKGWLIAKAVSTTPTTEAAPTPPTTEAATTPPTTEAVTTPPPPPTPPVAPANGGNSSGRRVVRRA